MNMTKTELETVLRSLQYAYGCIENRTVEEEKKIEAGINILRAELAKGEPVPVAWLYWQSCLNDDGTQTAPWIQRCTQFKPDESIINKDITPLYREQP